MPAMDDRELSRDPAAARAASPGAADLDAVEAALVELLATWGASEEPAAAEILRAVSTPGVPELLRVLHARGCEFLPPDLVQEIDQAVAVLGDGVAWRAQTFRSRMDMLLGRARDGLGRRLGELRRGAAAELLERGGADRGDELDRNLQVLWRADSAGSVEEHLAALDDLLRMHVSLAASGQSLARELDDLTASASAQTGDGGEVQSARSAARNGDPRAMALARDALRERRLDESERARLRELADMRSGLEAVWGRARSLLGDGAGGVDPGLARLLATAVTEAERTLAETAAALSSEAIEARRSALASWERALRSMLDDVQRTVESQRVARLELATSLENELERLARGNQGAAGRGGDDGSARAREAAAAALRDRAPGGGATLQNALQDALAVVREVGARHQSQVRSAAGLLQDAARRLAQLLDEDGHLMPTARVVKARLLIEQVDGIAAGDDVAGIEKMSRAIAADVESLEHMAALLKKRRSSAEESERDALQADIEGLFRMTGGGSRRLRSLAAEAKRAPAGKLGILKAGVDEEAAAIEREVRLRVGRALQAAERWLQGARKRPEAHRPKPAIEIEKLAGQVRGALQDADMPAVQARTHELLAALLRAAPLMRPRVRIGIAAGLLLAGAGARYFVQRPTDENRPRPVEITLAGEAGGPVTVTLYNVSDGAGMPPRSGRATAGTPVRFDLAPGRYDVYVEERYTGRSIRVPGDTVVAGIPIPAAP